MWERLAFANRSDGTYYSNLLNRAAEGFFADTTRDSSSHGRIAGQLRQIAVRCRELAYGMDFTFLVNAERGLLSIGYRVSDETLDGSCYDMLASEAALTNFLAVAKSDATENLWSKLGRSIVAVDNRACLLSWSGSMFEYLMPLLVLHTPERTL